MQHSPQINRRSFLSKSAGIGAAAAAVHSILPPSILGANEQIVMGIIGSGGRGRGVMQMHLKEGAKFAAVCDVYEPNLNLGLQLAAEKAKSYVDYRRLLEQSDLDAVLIATAEHNHCIQLIDSVQAGKDAYCEKPMSISIEEGAKTVKEVRKTDRIVQIGMQRRSAPSVHEAKKVVSDGLLGKVHMCRAQWFWQHHNQPLDNSPLGGNLDWEKFCYPRPVIEFEPMKYRYWRYFWNFSGGNVTDQGTHLMDVIQWFMESGTPRSAECFGKVYEALGSETPDTFSATYDYGDFLATWTLVYSNSFQNGWTIFFHGDKGTLILDDSGFRLFEEPWAQHRDKPLIDFKGGIGAQHHVKNFLDCVKSRQQPNAPVEVGHTAVCGPHLANVAWHNKRRAYLDENAAKATLNP
ncbi:MAG: Gfo/Idh/MocA family protein [Candidatus Hinthialibacter sp.]